MDNHRHPICMVNRRLRVENPAPNPNDWKHNKHTANSNEEFLSTIKLLVDHPQPQG
jgi:hypothetical protein